MSVIHVDFQKPLGPIKPMNAVNNGPLAQGRSQYRTNFNEFKTLSIPYARTHDSAHCTAYGGPHIIDVNKIFTNFDADVNDPASYDFFLTDRFLKTIMDAGAEPYYRLGESIEHWDKKYDTLPPRDFQKWAEICEHIIAHYTEGWADGHHWNITYWEIWNEPETLEGQDPKTMDCWGGTKEQFFDFFTVAAKHLKNRFPHLKIGGPALCWEHGWGRDFVKTMHERGVKLDFYSWHIYTDKIYKFKQDAELVRGYLDEFGFRETESHITEWNYVADWREGFVDTLLNIAGAKGAAFLAAAMIECQHLPVEMIMYYDMRPGSTFNGVFDIRSLKPIYSYCSLLAFARLRALGTEVESRSDDDTVKVLCAAGGNGRAGMLCYYTHEDNPETKTVTLSLGCAEAFRFYEACENGELKELDVQLTDGTAELTLDPYAVIYFEDKQ